MEQFKLNPYRELPLHATKLEAWIEAVEQALGFKLFFWQKTFIEIGVFRQYGETTARILRELSQIELPPLDYRSYRKKTQRERLYCEELLKIKAQLEAAGVQTRKVLVCEREYREYIRQQERLREEQPGKLWEI